LQIELRINDSADPKARYVSWAPSPCSVRLSDPTGASQPVQVTLRQKPAATGGQVRFRDGPSASAKTSLSLTLPLAGAPVPFFLTGVFGRASVMDGDVTVEVRAGTQVLGSVPLMVRVRKDAAKLTAPERDRFVAALAKFNDRGAGGFAAFRAMHTDLTSPEAHGAPGFLPWHRAYLLDLERELQAIDSSVALPYWRFDRPAPALFTPAFLGRSDSNGTVHFASTNPLQFWVTDGVPGINRRPFFVTGTASANVITEAQTLALGNQYAQFLRMEGNPHGFAHTSFGGSISSIDTAAKDPLFFLLHANVDRLWAKWQRRFGRFDPALAASFANGPSRIGHNLPDTMWPWNGITGGQRPATAPGGDLAASSCVTAPGAKPKVRDMLDFQGAVAPHSQLGFDYDDVRFA
jgi:tyrosinase